MYKRLHLQQTGHMLLFTALSEQSLLRIPAGGSGAGAEAGAFGPVVLGLLLVLRHPILGCRHLHGRQDHLCLTNTMMYFSKVSLWHADSSTLLRCVLMQPFNPWCCWRVESRTLHLKIIHCSFWLQFMKIWNMLLTNKPTQRLIKTSPEHGLDFYD